jgi:putative ABC transport system ATP-binding protein
VLENVVLPCRFSTLRRQRAEAQYRSVNDGAVELLQRLGFSAEMIATNSVLALSTGQQQRVAAARALLGAPEIIIADEPTSALDTEHRDRFIDLLIEQCQQLDSALIFVSHDPFLQSHFQRVETLKPYHQGGFYL